MISNKWVHQTVYFNDNMDITNDSHDKRLCLYLYDAKFSAQYRFLIHKTFQTSNLYQNKVSFVLTVYTTVFDYISRPYTLYSDVHIRISLSWIYHFCLHEVPWRLFTRHVYQCSRHVNVLNTDSCISAQAHLKKKYLIL